MVDPDVLCSARVGALYDAALDPARWPDALAGVADAVAPGTSACLFVERRPGSYAHVVSTRMDPAALAAFVAHYAPLDPMLAVSDDVAVGHTVHSSAVLTRSQQARTEFYVDFAWPHDLHVCRMVVVRRTTDHVSKLVCTTDDRRDRDRRGARAALARFTPHLRRAMDLAEHAAALRVERDAAVDALDHAAAAVIATDVASRVVFANDAAEGLLARADDLGVERAPHLGARGSLRAARTADTAMLRQLITTAAAAAAERPVIAGVGVDRGRRGRGLPGTPGGHMTLPRTGRAPLSVFVAPLRRRPDAADGDPAAPAALVVVTDPDGHTAPPDVTHLRASYGLTPAEARVALLVANGRSPAEVASVARVSVGTVRNQLKRVFAKTGTRRQSALARLVVDAERRAPPGGQSRSR